MNLKFDNQMMLKCLTLARKGIGFVEPNPRVGCVITKEGTMIGTGWHRRFGGLHAEIEALQRAGTESRGATMYVNLEPCSHFGKTPPCADRIIAAGIAQVVIGMQDPNPLVNGKGIKRLKDAGIFVRTGVLENDCIRLNSQFIVNTIERRTYALVKIAQSLNGSIASDSQTRSQITGKVSMKRVHKLRSIVDAVLIGANTLRIDDPLLTTRLVKGKNPKRIVLTASWKLPLQSRVFQQDLAEETFILSSEKAMLDHAKKTAIFQDLGIKVIAAPSNNGKQITANEILHALHEHQLYSVLVEGGSEVFTEFISSGHCDELHLFEAPIIYACGEPSFLRRKSNAMPVLFERHRFRSSGADTYSIFFPRK